MLKAALPLTTDAGVLMPSLVATRTLVVELRALIDGIDAYDRVIARVFNAHPDAFIFASLPGAGPTFAPRLPAAVGSDRERYESADAMQQYLGIAPVAERSGKSKWLRILYRCWKERKPYDEAKYLFVLKQRKAPLLKYMSEPLESTG